MKNLMRYNLTKREYVLLIQLLSGKTKAEIIGHLKISTLQYENICQGILIKTGYKSIFRLLADLYFEK